MLARRTTLLLSLITLGCGGEEVTSPDVSGPDVGPPIADMQAQETTAPPADTSSAPVDTKAPDTSPRATDTNTPDTSAPDTSAPDTTPPCVPKTCASENAECGTVDDGCGVNLNCGGCEPPNYCSASNQCLCKLECEGEVCGEKDGCGGFCQVGQGCCEHGCDAEGDTRCEAGLLQTCVVNGDSVCLDWTAGDACPGFEICNEGACCAPSCAGVPCGGGDGCGGVCAAGSGCCENECGADGLTVCVGDQVKTCGNYDGDACYEWSNPQSCPSGNCVNDACVPEAGPNCVNPVAVVAGPGATGNGVCDKEEVLLDDGKVAELWAGANNTWDLLGVPVSACMVVDFGKLCSPDEICVKAWAGEKGCSGDGCGGNCSLCKTVSKTAIDVFAYKSNSTLNYVYQYSMYIDATGAPGKTMCYKPTDEAIQFVLICRADCGATGWNAHVDFVYLN